MEIKYFLLILFIFLFAGCQSISQDKASKLVSPTKDSLATSTPTSTPEIIQVKPPTSTVTTESEDRLEAEKPGQLKFLDYPVAFASQAPFANWDELHEEACEEAAMIMAAKYFKKEPITPHIMEQGILNLVKWEENNGFKVDLTTDETAVVLKDYFDLTAEVTTDVLVEKIKKELLAGKLIIAPAAGRQLGNPNFKQPGPIYHMLVIRGYDDTKGEFITNDPGTKKGEGYRYKYQKLINAVHDWDHQLAEGGMTNEEMEQGRKVMVIISE